MNKIFSRFGYTIETVNIEEFEKWGLVVHVVL